MPLVVTCSKCKRRYILSLEESEVFRQIIKTKEQLDSILCPDCENEKENQINKTITVKNVDIDLLKEQREYLIALRNHYQRTETHMHLSGMIHFLDACIDAAEEGETDEN